MSACRACGAPQPADARFCGNCGRATPAHARAIATRFRADRHWSARAAVALALTCCGGIAAVLASGGGLAWSDVASQTGALLLAALAAAAVAGRWSESFPLRTGWIWLLVAVAAAVVTLLVAVAIVHVLGEIVGGTPAPDGEPDVAPDASGGPLVLFVFAVLLAPLAEEALCRGAGFRAAVVLSTPRVAILLTAIVFAFLHGLNGVFLLELPHRFAVGLVLGWLRWRSGSLLPAMLAHALHNLGAIAMAS